MKTRGFTLLELLFVMAILSSAIVLMFSKLSPLRASNLTVSGNKFVETLEYARQHAIAKSQFTMVGVMSDGRHAVFSLVRDDDGELHRETKMIFEGNVIREIKLPPEWLQLTPWAKVPGDVRFIAIYTPQPAPLPPPSVLEDYVIFEPGGAITGYASKKFTLRDRSLSDLHQYTVWVLQHTGTLKIERGEAPNQPAVEQNDGYTL